MWVLGAAVCVASCGPPAGGQSTTMLRPADASFRAGKIDDGVHQFASVKASLPPAAVRDFVAKHEPEVLAEIDARDKRGAHGAAFVLASEAAAAFGSPAATAKRDEVGTRWSSDLKAAIAKHEQASEPATAVLLRTALAAVTHDSADLDGAQRALLDLAGKHRLGVEARGDAAKLSPMLARDHRFDPAGRDAVERVQVMLKLGQPTSKTDVKRQKKSKQVEQGTRAVANPDRAKIEDEIAGHEDRLADLREQKQAEQESPTRSEASLEGFDQQIGVEQEQLDQARQDLQQTPTTTDEANVVDFDYEVEVHTLTVSRDVELEAKFTSGGQPVVLRDTVRVAKEDTAHEAYPEIGLAKDGVSLPDQRAVMPELDQALEKWSARAASTIYDAYRRRLLTGSGARGELLALYASLGAGAIDPAQATELEKLTGVPRPERLLAALDQGQLQTVFEATQATQPATSRAKSPGGTPKQSQTERVASRPEPVATKQEPVATKQEPVAVKADPDSDAVRAKAGRSLTITAFEIRRGAKVIVLVDRDGTLQSHGRATGVWQKTGVLEDAKGRAIVAVDKRGVVWTNEHGAKQAAQLKSGTLVLENGITLAIDGAGNVVLTRGKEREISKETIVPASHQDLVLLVAMLATGELHFVKAP
jgi:hypothetical protein